MRASPLSVVALAVLVLGGCTSASPSANDGATEATPTPAATTSTATSSASPSPSPSPTPTTATLGTGTVTVDGTEVPVSGDCDISKDFGQQPVNGLGDEEVDVLLAVDNVTDSGAAAGSDPLTVRLLGSGTVQGRTLTSVTRTEDGVEVTWEGPVTAASLRDREPREFLDVATLHLEATQRPVDSQTGSREVVVDVTCAISRPA